MKDWCAGIAADGLIKRGFKPAWNTIKTSTGKRQFPPTQQVVLELIPKS
jgi:hypothetical protein